MALANRGRQLGLAFTGRLGQTKCEQWISETDWTDSDLPGREGDGVAKKGGTCLWAVITTIQA
jgi:hypothetical protein